MSSYSETFEARGRSYLDAHHMAPHARSAERDLLIDRLALESARRICDVPSGGGYVASHIGADPRWQAEIVCIEPATAFASRIDPQFTVIQSEITRLDIADQSVDRVASLAGLHHTVDKAAFFNEACRVLMPGGRIAVADVQEDTPAARFLNDTVHHYTDTGHEGLFFRPGDMQQYLTDAGFVEIEERHEQFHWRFECYELLLVYCKMLFGLTKADLLVVEQELEKHFDIEETSDGALLPWSLVYAHGVKPAPGTSDLS